MFAHFLAVNIENGVSIHAVEAQDYGFAGIVGRHGETALIEERHVVLYAEALHNSFAGHLYRSPFATAVEAKLPFAVKIDSRQFHTCYSIGLNIHGACPIEVGSAAHSNAADDNADDKCDTMHHNT